MPALGQSEVRPTTLGRYELVAPIGRGGMAEVHLAVQRGPAGFEKLVVIKLVHEHLASQASFVEMLLDEARHAGLIKHPNVVEIYELGEEAGRYFIAMEYLEGEPLLEVIRIAGEGGARLDPLSIARVIADTAEGLEAAHRLKARDGRPIELVHHDVSLGNIVVLYSGLVKLVDFGVAKAQSASRGSARVQGKLGYMAPEKIEDRPVDRRSDIWSLGCVLWEALTLQRLFKGDSDADTVRQVLGASIPAPSEIDPSVPPELDPIVLRALQRDPNRRYQTAKGMAADLEEVLRELKYGAKNDRIAQHMEAVFAARIAARERVLQEISSKQQPSTATLDAAFGETITHAASTISSTGKGPAALPGDLDDGKDEPPHESTTMKTPPNPTDWKPSPAPAAAPPAKPAPAKPAAAKPAPAPAPAAPAHAAPAAPAPAPAAAAPPPPPPPRAAATPPPAPATPPRTPVARKSQSMAAAVLPAPARPARDTRPLSPGAFSQPRPRQTGVTETPKVFSVASLLEETSTDEPTGVVDPKTLVRGPSFTPPAAPPAVAAPQPPAPAPVAPTVLAPEPPTSPALPSLIDAPSELAPYTPSPDSEMDAEPPTIGPTTLPEDAPGVDWVAGELPPPSSSPSLRPPIVPSLRPRDERNPFEDDDFKTVADVIPANAEASRSLQSEPSWTVARQSQSLGELQRWVQESRNPPQSRWEALMRRLRPWHQRVTTWAQQRRIPRWSPYAAIAVVLLWTVLLIAKCSGGAAHKARPADRTKSTEKARPAVEQGPAKEPPSAAPANDEIELEEEPPPPPKKKR